LIVLAVAAGLGSLPPLAGPGYEYALACGVLLPPLVAIVTAIELTHQPRPAFSALGRGMYNAIGLALLAYIVSLLHGLRAGFCNAQDGSLLFLLGPGMGCWLASVWGAAVAEVARPRRHASWVAALLAFSGPLATALTALAVFYLTPMVFAFDPFVGFFSGAIYDTVVDWTPLVSYRAASLATLFACYIASLHLERDDLGAFTWRSLGRPGFVACGVVALVASLGSVAYGSRLGHWQTASTIREHLGGELELGDCHVIYDRSIAPDHLQRFAADCAAHSAELREWLGRNDRKPVTVYLFLDVGQKHRMMGAAGTSIAKPWRREIYLHNRAYPHPTLRHELAHALGGAIGRGPFDIAGRVGGWLPDPGLIEGLAEAAAPRDSELDGEQWAAAMLQIGELPSVESLFGLAFYANASSTSYTASGAFVRYVRETYGPSAVTSWYGGAALPQLVGKSWRELEAAWHDRLLDIRLDAHALAHARARFDRPGVFSRRCPHEVDARLQAAGWSLGIGDADGALGNYRRALALDSHNARALFGMARCHERKGNGAEAARQLHELATGAEVTVVTRQKAAEQLGDLSLRAGAVADAKQHYAEASRLAVDEGRLRTIDVKRHYADDEVARPAVLALLVGSQPAGPDHDEALDRIGHWRAERPDDGTPDYLFARAHLADRRYRLALERLQRAQQRGMPLERVAREAHRLQLVAHCALGELENAADALERYMASAPVRSNGTTAAQLLRRCRRAHSLSKKGM
jgi:tetratricopeptide (TPR) repeat protein